MGTDSHVHQGIPINEQMLRCIQVCTSCHAVCLHTVTVALYSDRLAKDDAVIRDLQDCAEICQTSADFMLRGSTLHGITCDACSRICAGSAAACEKFPENENMRACAETCRACEASCQGIAASAPNWRDQISGM